MHIILSLQLFISRFIKYNTPTYENMIIRGIVNVYKSNIKKEFIFQIGNILIVSRKCPLIL